MKLPNFSREQYIIMLIALVFTIVGVVAELYNSLGNFFAGWNLHFIGLYLAGIIDWLKVEIPAFWDFLIWFLGGGTNAIESLIRLPERFIDAGLGESNIFSIQNYVTYMELLGMEVKYNVVGYGALISIAVISFISYLASKLEVAIFSFGALTLLWAMGLWPLTVKTLSFAIVVVGVSAIIAIPVGIIASLSDIFYSAIRPFVDMMQTLPAYVYFVPAVAIFGIGRVGGIVAATIFAIPPLLRMTNTGLRNIPHIYREVGDSFGANTLQRLLKIDIPSALPEIMQGVNQCIMYALAMAVIAGWLGGFGLGKLVWDSITYVSLDTGIEGGFAITFLAIILDRSSQGLITKAARRYGTEVGEAGR